jgi:hypothetical protein
MKMIRASVFAAAVIAVFAGCASGFGGRGHGPVESFQFLTGRNTTLDQNLTGTLYEQSDPATIEVVVPPGTDVSRLVATLSLNAEAVITIVSSGRKVEQQNGVTANDFSAPVLYSIEVPKTKTTWSYRITVREAETNATLGSLAVAGATLQPAFSPRVKNYSAEVPFASTSVRIDMRGQSAGMKSISVDGTPHPGSAPSVSVDFRSGSERSVLIETLAEDDATSEAYTLILRRGDPDRNALLSALEIANLPLAPAFSPSRNSYQAVAPYDSRRIVLKAKAQSRFASIELATTVVSGRTATRAPLTFKGNPGDASGADVEFTESNELPIIVSVTAQDGSIMEYLVDVIRAAPDRNNDLQSLEVANAKLGPVFRSGTISYSADVPFSSTQVTVFAKPQSALAKIVLEAETVPRGQSLLVKGDPASKTGAEIAFTIDRLSLSIVVTAQDGTPKRYLLDVRRAPPDNNADLASLLVSAGALSPAFSPRNISYIAIVPSSVENVKITAAAASSVADVVMEGQNLPKGSSQSATVSVPAGRLVTVNVFVTAEDGTQKLYRIQLSREAVPAPRESNARLGTLQVAGAVLTPAFDPAILDYDARIAADAAHPLVVAQPESSGASVSLDGQPLPRTGAVVLVNPGAPRSALIEVTAENGTRAQTMLRITRDSLVETPPQTGTDRVSVSMRNLKLGSREAAGLSSRKEKVSPQARITVRAYRTRGTIAQETVPVTVKQTGSNYTFDLQWRSPGVSLDRNGMVEVEVAVRTDKGWLCYTEALDPADSLNLSVPFLLYAANPQVVWPAVGKSVKVAGYVSLIQPGKLRALDKETLEKNSRGEYGVSVEFRDAANGKLLAKSSVKIRNGLPREYVYAFVDPVSLPEGSTVSYVLSAKNKAGVVWEASGTSEVWTVKQEYAGGFEPVVLRLLDELAAKK